MKSRSVKNRCDSPESARPWKLDARSIFLSVDGKTLPYLDLLSDLVESCIQTRNGYVTV